MLFKSDKLVKSAYKNNKIQYKTHKNAFFYSQKRPQNVQKMNKYILYLEIKCNICKSNSENEYWLNNHGKRN